MFRAVHKNTRVPTPPPPRDLDTLIFRAKTLLHKDINGDWDSQREEFSQQASWVREKGENPGASEQRICSKRNLNQKDQNRYNPPCHSDGLFIVM